MRCVPEPSRQQLITYGLCAVAIALVGFNYLRHSGKGAPQAPPPAAPIKVDSGSERLVVDVAGAVRHPGVYRVAGGRVVDAVRRAGGARPGADLAAINLAAKLADGQQIVVPARPAAGVTGAGATTGGGAAASGAKISLGSATPEQLDTLDGVGQVTAQKILDYRQKHGGFRSAEDLMQIPGIGEKTFEALKDKVQP